MGSTVDKPLNRPSTWVSARESAPGLELLKGGEYIIAVVRDYGNETVVLYPDRSALLSHHADTDDLMEGLARESMMNCKRGG